MDDLTYTWEQWCGRFRATLKELQYRGPVLMSSFHDDWEQDAAMGLIAKNWPAPAKLSAIGDEQLPY